MWLLDFGIDRSEKTAGTPILHAATQSFSLSEYFAGPSINALLRRPWVKDMSAGLYVDFLLPKPIP